MSTRLGGVNSWTRAVASLDLRALALFRMGLGVVVATDALSRLLDAALFYTDRGIAPSPPSMSWLAWLARPSLLWWEAGPAWPTVCLVLTALVGVGVALGAFTRVMTVAAWLLVLSVQHRNTLINFGADQVIVVSCLLACCLPVSARWSVDAWRGTAVWPLGERGGAVFSPATVALVFQLIAIYLFNVANKDGDGWFTGTAVLQALHLDAHATWLGMWIREHAAWLSPLLTWATLAVEGSVLLLFVPREGLRTLLVGVMWCLHLGFALTMYLGLFSPACMVLWLAVLPSSAVTRGLRLLRVEGGADPSSSSTSWASPRPASASETVGEQGPSPSRARWAAWWASGLVACVVVGLQYGVNVAKLGGPSPPPGWIVVARALSVHNAWRMFGDPNRHDGWWVIPGTLHNGRVVDLFRDGERRPVFKKPANVGQTYKTSRWRRLMMHIARKDTGIAERRALARYYCHTWNASHVDDDRLRTVAMVFMEERTQDTFIEPRPKRRELLTYDCDHALVDPAAR